MGEGESGIALGDAVSVIPPISMIRYPAHGELTIFPAAHIVKHPPSLGWQEAAALWMPFLTAYGALIDIAQLQPAGHLVHEVIQAPMRLAAAKAFILDGLASGGFKPVIAKTSAFDNIVDTHRYLESNQQIRQSCRDVVTGS
jgi:NADPH:quinone reductase-like Zn-dependent oxidoreductase